MSCHLPPHKKTLAYWDAQAPWQKRWLTHNDYHRQILNFLLTRVRPGWRVLDVGAGNGVLALPLTGLGCRVMVLEPSRGMRDLLEAECQRRQLYPEKVDPRRWEEVPLGELQGYDLILACNFLQLSTLGLEKALRKIFAARPSHVCVVSEVNLPHLHRWSPPGGYYLARMEHFQTDSSMAYHHLEEVAAHLAHRLGRKPTPKELAETKAKLVRENQLLWLKNLATVGLFWWQRYRKFKGEKHAPEKAAHLFVGLGSDLAMEPGTG